MKWQGGRKGGNIEDRRSGTGGKGIAIGGVTGIILLVLGLLLGGDPTQLLQQMQNQYTAENTDQSGVIVSTPEEDRLMEFSEIVLTSTDEVWTQLFSEIGERYKKPTLLVYREVYETGGCGTGRAAFGPFYCPADQKIYLDLSFNSELTNKFGAKGEFALAYVIAHEVGHHIQHLLGVLNKTNDLRSKLSDKAYNKISVMTELQADFYAGVWAHHVNRLTSIELTYQDIVDGMEAAAAVGDDHLQEQAQGHSNPESFTHGTSAQRTFWFKKGYDSGDLNLGNTFDEESLR